MLPTLCSDMCYLDIAWLLVSSAGLVDLDELVLRCRNPEARSYIAEAGACYRAGAFKSCIVATWTAVVYDYLAKLRELEASADASATQQLKEFEQIRASRNPSAAQRFEQEWLKSARDEFEFLTPLEHTDFDRLREDRNRCAHPAMRTSSEPYQPTAELARYHLRNAVDHMLAVPPVQGKAALDRLQADLDLASFPTDVDDTLIFLRAGPLGRARDSLVRNYVDLVVKQLMRGEGGDEGQDRRYAALLAILQLYVDVAESAMIATIEKVVAGLNDDQLPYSIAFAARVPGTWDLLGTPLQQRVVTMLRHPEGFSSRRVVLNVLRIPQLEELAVSELPRLPDSTLAALLTDTSFVATVDEAIRRFAESGSFDEARRIRRRLIAPIVDHLTYDQTRRLLGVFRENDQVKYSHGTCDLLVRILHATDSYAVELQEEWDEVRRSGFNRNLRGYADLRHEIEQRLPGLEELDDSEEEPIW